MIYFQHIPPCTFCHKFNVGSLSQNPFQYHSIEWIHNSLKFSKSLSYLGHRRGFSLFSIANSEMSRIIVHELVFFLYNREIMKTKCCGWKTFRSLSPKKNPIALRLPPGEGLQPRGESPFPRLDRWIAGSIGGPLDHWMDKWIAAGWINKWIAVWSDGHPTIPIPKFTHADGDRSSRCFRIVANSLFNASIWIQ